MTDLILKQLLAEAPFTWGRVNLVEQGEKRGKYIAALKAADAHDFSLLLAFARS